MEDEPHIDTNPNNKNTPNSNPGNLGGSRLIISSSSSTSDSSTNNKNSIGRQSNGMGSSTNGPERPSSPGGKRVVAGNGTHQQVRIQSGQDSPRVLLTLSGTNPTNLEDGANGNRLLNSPVMDENSNSRSSQEKDTSSFQMDPESSEWSGPPEPSQKRMGRLPTPTGGTSKDNQLLEHPNANPGPFRFAPQQELQEFRDEDLSPGGIRNRRNEPELEQLGPNLREPPILNDTPNVIETPDTKTQIVNSNNTNVETEVVVLKVNKASEPAEDKKSSLYQRQTSSSSSMENNVPLIQLSWNSMPATVLDSWAPSTQKRYRPIVQKFLSSSQAQQTGKQLNPLDIVRYCEQNYSGLSRATAAYAISTFLDIAANTKLSDSPMISKFTKGVKKQKGPTEPLKKIQDVENVTLLKEILMNNPDLNSLNDKDIRTLSMLLLQIECALRPSDIACILKGIEFSNNYVKFSLFNTKEQKLSPGQTPSKRI